MNFTIFKTEQRVVISKTLAQRRVTVPLKKINAKSFIAKVKNAFAFPALAYVPV